MHNTNTTKIKNVTTIGNDSVQLEIDLTKHNLLVNGRKVQSITMYTDTDCIGT